MDEVSHERSPGGTEERRLSAVRATGAVPAQAAPDGASLSQELDAALAGAELGHQDRHFLARLAAGDRANATPVVSLLWKARLAGRAEAALAPQELDTVIRALKDAARYRESGADSMGCWDCENMLGPGRCAEHSQDYDRADACIALARVLTAIRGAAAKDVSLPVPAVKSAGDKAGMAAATQAEETLPGQIAAKSRPGLRRVGLPQQRGDGGFSPATT
jgi:hypothetical protein